MNSPSHFPMALRFLSLTVLAAALAGCNREEVKVYTIPKETAAAPTEAAMPAGHPDAGGRGMGSMGSGVNMGMDPSARPKLIYKTPEGWTEADLGSMRVASFKINQDGQQADVSVIPLAGIAGGEVANVNRWRGQVGLPPVSEEELKKSAQAIQVAGEPAELFEMTGKNPESGAATRVLGAIQNRNEVAWFFKVTGDDQLVASQKPVLLEFLKSVKFEVPGDAALPASHPPIDGMSLSTTSAGTAPVSHESQPTWQVPAGWKEAPGNQFLVAKFLISEANEQAAVNVSAAMGGLAANVNRWRQQVGLPAASEAEISKQATDLEVPNGKAVLVEISGTDPQTSRPVKIVGVMVSQADQTWFYKLAGDAKLVEARKDVFTKFVQSARY